MDETIVRGLIIGAALGIIGLVISIITKLIKSPTELARRTRIVAGIALTAFVAALMLEAFGVVATVVVAAVIAAVVWVINGRNS